MIFYRIVMTLFLHIRLLLIMDIKGVVQRGPNTYRFTISRGFDGNGKNVRHTMTFKVPEGTPPTKAEKLVRQAYTDFERKCKNSQFGQINRFHKTPETDRFRGFSL